MILGIPNCSYVDGELRYGAMMKNFRQPDLSLMIKGVAFPGHPSWHRKALDTPCPFW